MMRTVVVATALSMLMSVAAASLTLRLSEREITEQERVSRRGWDHDEFARGLIETIVERINSADIERMRREVDVLMAR